jgi:hypothetical protein
MAKNGKKYPFYEEISLVGLTSSREHMAISFTSFLKHNADGGRCDLLLAVFVVGCPQQTNIK